MKVFHFFLVGTYLQVATAQFGDMHMNQNDFLMLLDELVTVGVHLQQPEPQEEFAVEVLQKFFAEAVAASNGRLTLRPVTYVERRPNLFVTYEASNPTDDVLSLVGSHLDVVLALPDGWDTDPFNLTRRDDMLVGRGVSDCLGNVATVSNLFRDIAFLNPSDLNVNLVAVFIANEESSSTPGVGIDELLRQGELDYLINGPLYWVDTTGFGPTIGSAGSVGWSLTSRGHMSHSGRPQNGINAVQMATNALAEMESQFYEAFPYTDFDAEYGFQVGTNMKGTGILSGDNVVNQIPELCVITGDIRVTPSFTNDDVMEFAGSFIENLDVTTLPTTGYGRYDLPDGTRGSLEIEFAGSPYRGVATDLNAPSFQSLFEAIQEIRGSAEAVSTGGSLPVVGDLREMGYDLQMTGFGVEDNIHGDNEFGYLSDFVDGYRVLAVLIDSLN